MLEVFHKVVKDQAELAHCFEIRKEVFVHEQGVLEESDMDYLDSQAIHVLASYNGLPIGTVRLYEEDERVWFGGRLAVLKEFRGKGVGKSLIAEATKLVKEKGAQRFLAYVQSIRVALFIECGWKPIDGPMEICGMQHMLMEASLDA